MKYGVTTDMAADRVVAKAIDFFGRHGLEVKERGAGSVLMESGIGFVSLQACGEGPVEVDVETREYDPQVKTFIQRIGF